MTECRKGGPEARLPTRTAASRLPRVHASEPHDLAERNGEAARRDRIDWTLIGEF